MLDTNYPASFNRPLILLHSVYATYTDRGTRGEKTLSNQTSKFLILRFLQIARVSLIEVLS